MNSLGFNEPVAEVIKTNAGLFWKIHRNDLVPLGTHPLYTHPAPLADRAVPEVSADRVIDIETRMRPSRVIDLLDEAGGELNADYIVVKDAAKACLAIEDVLENFVAAPTGEVEPRPCCHEYATCMRPCTPRGREQALKELADEARKNGNDILAMQIDAQRAKEGE